MKIKTADATNKQINWLVATIQDIGCLPPRMYNWMIVPADGSDDFYSPSTDWGQGGPIIEGEGIAVYLMPGGVGGKWRAESGMGYKDNTLAAGPTALIAAMRCYVASKLGDEVEIPDELT